MSLTEAKAALRREIQLRVRSILDGERISNSRALVARLAGHEAWLRAGSVLLFSPLPDEVEISPLIQTGIDQGKTICLPRFVTRNGDYEAAVIRDVMTDLQPAKYGILEPAPACPARPLNQLDLALVPGVAFAPGGSRLGRGRGHYDRILKLVSGMRLGVAFDEQIVDALPSEPHDVRVHAVVTPGRWIGVAPAGV